MLRRTFTTTAAAALLGAGLAGVATIAAAQEPMELTFHTIMVTEDPIAQGARLFAERLEELSGGTMTMNVFDSAQLFAQNANADALSRGQIQLAESGFSGFEDIMPYTSMFTSAYIFTSAEHAQRFWDSEAGRAVFDELAEKANIRILNGMVYYGTRQLSLTDNVDRTIMTPQDMEGVKLRMANYPGWIALGEALNASPTPIAFNETYLAMQTGVVDGQDNGLTVSKAMGFDELTSQLVLTDHLVWNLHYAINEDVWQSLTDEQRGWVQQAADEAHAYATDLIRQGEEDLIEEFRAQGIKIVEPDKEAFIAFARNYYATHDEVTADWDWELYETIASMAD